MSDIRSDLREAADASHVAVVRFEIGDGTTLRPRQPVTAEEFAAALLARHGIVGDVVHARMFRPLGGDCTAIEAHIENGGDA